MFLIHTSQNKDLLTSNNGGHFPFNIYVKYLFLSQVCENLEHIFRSSGLNLMNFRTLAYKLHFNIMNLKDH